MLHFPMLALAICWMTAWWKATVLPGDKQRARLCPVAFHLVKLTPLQLWSRVFMFSGCFYDVFFICIQGAVRARSSAKRCLGQLLRGKANASMSSLFFHHNHMQKSDWREKKNPQPGCDHLNFKALASRHIYAKRSAIETLSHAPCF